MSHTLGGWNRIIFISQVSLLCFVAVMAYVTSSGVQAAVLGGLGGLAVLTAMHAMGAMKQERGIVYDLSIGNASGLVSLFFFVAAVISGGSVPGIAAGLLSLLTSVVMGVSAAWGAATLKVSRPMRELLLSALPLGVGPLYEWMTRRVRRTAEPS